MPCERGEPREPAERLLLAFEKTKAIERIQFYAMNEEFCVVFLLAKILGRRHSFIHFILLHVLPCSRKILPRDYVGVIEMRLFFMRTQCRNHGVWQLSAV